MAGRLCWRSEFRDSPELSEFAREAARDDRSRRRLERRLFSDGLSYWANFSFCSCLTRRCRLMSRRERRRSMKWRTQRRVPQMMAPI